MLKSIWKKNNRNSILLIWLFWLLFFVFLLNWKTVSLLDNSGLYLKNIFIIDQAKAETLQEIQAEIAKLESQKKEAEKNQLTPIVDNLNTKIEKLQQKLVEVKNEENKSEKQKAAEAFAAKIKGLDDEFNDALEESNELKKQVAREKGRLSPGGYDRDEEWLIKNAEEKAQDADKKLTEIQDKMSAELAQASQELENLKNSNASTEDIAIAEENVQTLTEKVAKQEELKKTNAEKIETEVKAIEVEESNAAESLAKRNAERKETEKKQNSLWTKVKKALSDEEKTMLEKAGIWMSTATKWLMMPSLSVLGYVGKLMENEFIFDSNQETASGQLLGMEGMEGMLKEIWILMRDIVNVLFVLVLLFVAFINVVKEAWSTSGWELKAILPKIVIALVAVNFSWSACKVLIDLSNVGTATILAIPQSFWSSEDKLKCKELEATKGWALITEDSLCIPNIRKFIVDTNLGSWVNADKTIVKLNQGNTGGDILRAMEQMDKIEGMDMDYESNAVSYLLWLAGNDIVTMAKNQEHIQTLEDLTIDALVSVILAIAYFIVFICLFIVLMARLVVVWIVIAFSPILVLQFVMGDKFSITDKIGDVKIFKEFFMPMLVAFPIVIGHIMLTAGKTMTWTAASWDTTLFDNMFGGYNLMWKIAAIVILWMGVFSAMNESVAKGVVGTIKSGAQSAGRFAMKAFRYAPVFPVKVDSDGDGQLTEKDRNATFADLANMTKIPSQIFDQKERQSREDIRNHAKSVLNIDLGGKTADLRDFEAIKPTDAHAIKGALEKVAQGDSELTSDERKRIVNHLKEGRHLEEGRANQMMKLDDDQFRSALNDRTYVKNREIRDGNYNYRAKAEPTKGPSAETLSGEKAAVHVGNQMSKVVNNKIEAVTDNNDKGKLDARTSLYSMIENISGDSGTTEKVLSELETQSDRIDDGKDKGKMKAEIEALGKFIKDTNGLDELQGAIGRAKKEGDEETRVGYFKAISEAVSKGEEGVAELWKIAKEEVKQIDAPKEEEQTKDD